jgi:hypothetical protein
VRHRRDAGGDPSPPLLRSLDEHENATISNYSCQFLCPVILQETPAVSAKPSRDIFFPQKSGSADDGGWIYFNLDGVHLNGEVIRPAQAWVIVRMTDSRRAILFDAAHLGNGCSPPIRIGATIAPTGGVPVCPTGSASCALNPAYTGTNVTP